jgi:hypothetical protein
MRLASIAALPLCLGLAALWQQKTNRGAGAAGRPPVRAVVETKIREAWQDF